MPIYLYRHPETEEIKEIVQGMNDKHVYFEGEIEWKRVYTKPNASIDTQINEFSQKEFVEKTGQMKGSVGDMLDLSAELSEKRKERAGEDPVQKQFFKDYQKKNGVKHMHDKKKVIEKNGIKVDL